MTHEETIHLAALENRVATLEKHLELLTNLTLEMAEQQTERSRAMLSSVDDTSKSTKNT